MDRCSTARCSFGALAGDELPSFYSTILNWKPEIFFISLFVIHIFSWKSPNLFSIFYWKNFTFLLLSFESFWICKSFIRYVTYKYFFPVTCLFIFLTESFKEQKVLILIKSSLSISVYFVVHASGGVTEKTLHNPVSQKFSIFF